MRNKNPEQTYEQIIVVSANLFKERGYDKTSIQDIIDALGMSKGAIYHHFKSKEEVLNAVIDRQFSYAAYVLNNLITSSQAINAKEKLIHILEKMMSNHEIHSIDRVLSSQVKNPQFVVSGIQEGCPNYRQNHDRWEKRWFNYYRLPS